MPLQHCGTHIFRLFEHFIRTSPRLLVRCAHITIEAGQHTIGGAGDPKEIEIHTPKLKKKRAETGFSGLLLFSSNTLWRNTYLVHSWGMWVHAGSKDVRDEGRGITKCHVGTRSPLSGFLRHSSASFTSSWQEHTSNFGLHRPRPRENTFDGRLQRSWGTTAAIVCLRDQAYHTREISPQRCTFILV